MESSNNAAAVNEGAENNPANGSDEQLTGTDGAQASAEGTQPPPKPANKKKFKLKVDGQEVEEEFDLDDEEGLKRHFQMSKAASKRMQEAASTKKQAETFIRMLKQDPVAVLSNPHLGVDFRKIAEDYLFNVIQEETLSPEQKKLRDAEKIIREREDEQRRKQEETEAAQQQALMKHYAEDAEKKIMTALDGGGLPKTPKTVKRMAELMYKNIEYGFDLDPKMLVEMVREDYVAEIKELFGSADGDALLNILGDDVANKIRKSDLARLTGGGFSGTQGRKPQEQAQSSSAPKAEKKPMTKDEWKALVDRRARS